MIANCPACGTHYKHEPSPVPVRGRCGRCDAPVDLSGLRPYRILSYAAPRTEDAVRAATYRSIGLDHPALATTIAGNVGRSSNAVAQELAPRLAPPTVAPLAVVEPPPHDPSPDVWETDDPLPPIPEMTTRGAFEASVPPVTEADILSEIASKSEVTTAIVTERAAADGRGVTFMLWLVAGAIVGTGASWTIGGTTLAGISVGASLGAVTGWGWLRWASPR